MMAGPVLTQSPNRWVNGGSSVSFSLNSRNVRTLPISVASLARYTGHSAQLMRPLTAPPITSPPLGLAPPRIAQPPQLLFRPPTPVAPTTVAHAH